MAPTAIIIFRMKLLAGKKYTAGSAERLALMSK
jgi:hypothetical protein